jgi:hypothetical protein
MDLHVLLTLPLSEHLASWLTNLHGHDGIRRSGRYTVHYLTRCRRMSNAGCDNCVVICDTREDSSGERRSCDRRGNNIPSLLTGMLAAVHEFLRKTRGREVANGCAGLAMQRDAAASGACCDALVQGRRLRCGEVDDSEASTLRFWSGASCHRTGSGG